MDRELRQDLDGVNESFWDGLDVEFDARYFWKEFGIADGFDG